MHKPLNYINKFARNQDVNISNQVKKGIRNSQRERFVSKSISIITNTLRNPKRNLPLKPDSYSHWAFYIIKHTSKLC